MNRLAALLLSAVIGTACDRPQPTGPSPNPQPVVVRVEISGPASIPPGQSAQFAAISRLSDGTSRAAATVRWNSQTGLFRVDASGLVTAGERVGEGILSAEVSSDGTGAIIRGSREILVLPDGTYRMVGAVTEDVPPMVPVVGARVEVTNGTPLVATTDWEGHYRLYGVAGEADIRVTKEGYQPHVQRVQLAEHVTRNFQLALSGTRLELDGPYTFAIDVECEGSVPLAASLRHLSYAAFVTQTGSALDVVLIESSRFRVNSAGRGDRFSGRVDAAGAAFMFDAFPDDASWWYFGGPYAPSAYPDVVERLPDGTFLIISGTAVVRGSPAALAGDLLGTINHFDSRFLTIPLLSSHTGTCYPLANRLTLTRR